MTRDPDDQPTPRDETPPPAPAGPGFYRRPTARERAAGVAGVAAAREALRRARQRAQEAGEWVSGTDEAPEPLEGQERHRRPES